ncbi:unnamed protein product, partial [marine sediment metagenome]
MVLDVDTPILVCTGADVVNGVDSCSKYVTLSGVDVTDNCVAAGTTIVNDYNGTSNASDVYDVGT